ncbi:MAG TPA: GNAT family N-acetyltransferase [Caldimonas sp.]|jgi:ElaA protein|nr:GNAT family N-acetyltransferase [Caldimonas sp.]HEX4233321.1 GNAT family N-acetyltransferase [Caldimonas sp.]
MTASALALEVLVWRCVPFDSLTPRELDRIYAARQRVFAVEQGCAYLDADGRDEVAHHLAAWAPAAAEPVAYARLLAPGAKYSDASIGRVLTSLEARGRGLGRELMERSLALVEVIWPATAVRISAQTRLEGFYASLGFVAVGTAYLEDGIDHTEMLRTVDASSF